LSGGICNSTYRILLNNSDQPFVLRLYDRDPSACALELDLIRLVRADVPVPEIIYAEREGRQRIPPFVLMEYVAGLQFRELWRGGNPEAIAQAARSIGEVLARISSYCFDQPGKLGPGPKVKLQTRAPQSTLQTIEDCLASPSFCASVPSELAEKMRAMAWHWADRLSNLDCERALVHGDFNKRNILVRKVNGCWKVAAILDWEFAFSGSPIWDLASISRYERPSRPPLEPYFSQGCLSAGMVLADDWRGLARVADLAPLCRILASSSTPADVRVEVLELVRATVEGRSPILP
jgi:aminoglycoside phosphotransferase (APT) family kinase protein